MSVHMANTWLIMQEVKVLTLSLLLSYWDKEKGKNQLWESK